MPAEDPPDDPGTVDARAVRFHLDKKLNVYKKAKLGNVFKWRLKELGYSDSFIDNATKEIVNRLAAN